MLSTETLRRMLAARESYDRAMLGPETKTIGSLTVSRSGEPIASNAGDAAPNGWIAVVARVDGFDVPLRAIVSAGDLRFACFGDSASLTKKSVIKRFDTTKPFELWNLYATETTGAPVVSPAVVSAEATEVSMVGPSTPMMVRVKRGTSDASTVDFVAPQASIAPDAPIKKRGRWL